MKPSDAFRNTGEELRFRAGLLDDTPDSIHVLDLDGKIVYINGAMCRATGYARKSLIGRDIRALFPKADPALVRSRIRNILDNGPVRFETVCSRKDGSSCRLEVHARALEAGGKTLIVAAGRALTDRKRLEKRLQESEEQLRHIQKVHALGRLAGGIAHDLNNILSVIIGSAEFLLKTAPPGDPRRADLEEILKAGGSAAELTRQLMTFSRKQAVRPKPLELDSVIPEVLGMARRIIPKTIAFKTALRSSPARVLADRGQLEQVLINLLVNARDAMPDGGTIKVETSRTGNGAGRRVLLAVSDTGHGMSRRIMGRLFEPFFTTKDPGEGSGLGLSTIYGIVRQSDGDISVDSEPGMGSTFRICFPETSGETE